MLKANIEVRRVSPNWTEGPISSKWLDRYPAFDPLTGDRIDDIEKWALLYALEALQRELGQKLWPLLSMKDGPKSYRIPSGHIRIRKQMHDPDRILLIELVFTMEEETD